MLAAMTFFPHELVWTDSPVELVGIFSIIVLLVTVVTSAVQAYRHSRCHDSTCRNRLHMRRHGKYPHGHLKLCQIHKPGVPDDGKITLEHIEAETARKEPVKAAKPRPRKALAK